MTGSKEDFGQMRSQGYDIDYSGIMYQEPKPKLTVTHTNFGKFYKADIDGEEITREKLYEILGIEDTRGFRLEFYLCNLQRNSSKYVVDIWEQNVE